MRPSLCHRLSFFSLLATFMVACGPTPQKGQDLKVEPAHCEVSGKTYGIVGGEILSSGNELSASTVLVAHIDKEDKVSVCTGTLIGENKVLTAAHCTTPHGKKTVIAFTNNASCLSQAPKRTLRLVTEEKVHPDYSYENTTYENAAVDLAVFTFQGEAPLGYKVRALPPPQFEISSHDTLVLTGYGTTGERTMDSGTLRFTTSSAAKLLPEFYIAALKKTMTVQGALTLEQLTQGVCSGDSGGPLYVRTSQGLVLVGITSMGIDHRTLDEKKARTCHGVALFTDVRSQLEWIEKQL